MSNSMQTLPDSNELKHLDQASADLITLIIDALRSERGMHLPTIIAAPGVLAGLALLRATGVDVSTLTPGTPVLVDAVNDGGENLVTFMSMLSKMLGMDADSSWNDPVPDNCQPQPSLIELEAKLEQPFIDLADRKAVPVQFRPHLAALAALKLVVMGRNVLSPEIGKALILSTVVAACKTVPHDSIGQGEQA